MVLWLGRETGHSEARSGSWPQRVTTGHSILPLQERRKALGFSRAFRIWELMAYVR